MKTIKKLVVLVMAVILMAGCTFKTNAGFKIAKDGKVAVTMIMAMDDEMIDTFLTISKMDQSELAGAESPDDIDVKEHTDAERWEFLESDDNSMFEDMDDMEGFEKAKYDKDGMKGYIFTKEVGTLDEITKDSATERVDVSEAIEDSKFSGKVLFTKNGDVYKSNMKITATEGTDQESLDQIKEYGGKLDVYFIVELPVKPTSSNADTTENDGKTLKWDMYKSKNLDFEFSLNGSSGSDEKEGTKDSKKDKAKSKDEDEDKKSNVVLFAGIGAGALLLVVIIAAVAVSSSKKKKAAANVAVQQAPVMGPMEQPVQPAQPVQIAQPTDQPVDPNQQNPGQ